MVDTQFDWSGTRVVLFAREGMSRKELTSVVGLTSLEMNQLRTADLELCLAGGRKGLIFGTWRTQLYH